MLATLLLLLPAGAPQDTAPATHPVELRISPLVELWLEVRTLSESKADTFASEELTAAVNAMRGLRRALGPAMGFGLIEANVEGSANAEELAVAFEDLPEAFQSRNGAEVVLREPCIAAAAAVAELESAWLAKKWPTRESELVLKQSELEVVLAKAAAPIYARLHRNFGLRVTDVTVPVYLVTRAPWPGAFTHRRAGGGGVAFVAIEDDPSALLEAVVHETIHALDIVTPGQQSLLVQLRGALVAGGLEPRATRDWAHTLFFLEAGACVREFVNPEHVDYGDRTDFYARSKPAVDVERPLWESYTEGKLDRDALITAIVEAATEGSPAGD